MADVEKKVNILTKIISNTKDGAMQTNRDIESIRENGKRLSEQFKDVGESMTGLGAKLSVGLTAPILLFAKGAIDASSNAEMFNVALTTMLGSQEKALDMQQKLVDFASKTPFELTQIQDATKQLLAYGFAGEDIIPILKDVGDVSAGLGQDKLPVLLRAIGQINAKGKLMGGELLQLREAGFNLADAMGITNDELEEMMAQGKITSKEVLKAFNDMTSEGGTFFNLMEKQSETFGGQMSNLKDKVTQLMVTFGTLMLPMLKEVVAKVGDWVEKLKNLDPNVQKIIIVVGGLLAVLGPVLIVLGSLITAIGTVAGVISGPVIAIGLLIAGVIALGVAFYKLMDSMNLVTPITIRIEQFFLRLKGSWETLQQAFQSEKVQQALEKLRAKFDEVKEKFEPTVQRIKDLFSDLFAKFDSIFAGDTLGESFFTLEGAINFVVGALEGLIAVIDFLMPAFEFMANAIIWVIDANEKLQQTIANVILFFMNFDTNVKQIWENFKQSVANAIDSAIQWLDVLIFEKVPFFIGSMIKWFSELPTQIPIVLENLWTLMGEKWAMIVATAGEVWENIKTTIATKFGEAVAWLVGKVEDIKNTFKGQNLKDIGTNLIQGFWDGIKAKWNEMTGWMGDAVSRFVKNFKDGLGVKSPSVIFKGIAENVAKGFGNGLDTGFGGIVSKAQGVATSVVNGFKSSIGTVNSMQSITQGAIASASGMISSAMGGIGKMGDSISNAVSPQLNLAGAGANVSSKTKSNSSIPTTGGDVYNVTVNVGAQRNGEDDAEFGRRIAREITNVLRISKSGSY